MAKTATKTATKSAKKTEKLAAKQPVKPTEKAKSADRAAQIKANHKAKAARKLKAARKAAAAAAAPNTAANAAPKLMPKKKVRKLRIKRFTMNMNTVAKDGFFDTAAFEKFLRDRIKVDGKTGQLGDRVRLVRRNNKIMVSAIAPFSKRYLKYLTKKYLCNQKLRDYIRVVAPTKATYELRYFKVSDDVEAEEN